MAVVKTPMVKFMQKHVDCAEALELPAPQACNRLVKLVAAAALIDRDSRVLLAKRPVGKPMAGLWEFPGGKVEAGEAPEYALMRELHEELGIETRPCCFTPVAFASHAYDDFHLLMPLFVCRTWKGFVTPHEGQDFKWVKGGDLENYEMPAADVPLIEPLMRVL